MKDKTGSEYCKMTGFAVSGIIGATILLMGYNGSLVAALISQLKCVLHVAATLFYVILCE